METQQTNNQPVTGLKAAPTPSTAKAKQTQRKLLQAARTVFERDGFLYARVADIAVEAGVSHGTFYTYFKSKTDIFRTVIAEVMALAYDTRRTGSGDHLSPIQRIERANRQFVRVYHEHGAMLGLMEQVATFDEELRASRIATREEAVARVHRSIERMQTNQEISAGLDPGCAARALVSMVSNFVYFWLIMGDGDYDDETAVRTLTELWSSALGLTERNT